MWCAAGVQKGEAMRSIMLDLLSDAYQSGLADKGGVRLPQEVVGPLVTVISVETMAVCWQTSTRALCYISLPWDVTVPSSCGHVSRQYACPLDGCCTLAGAM